MGDLIDKDKLMEELGISHSCEDCSHAKGVYCDMYTRFVDACEAISDAKPVEAIPIEWIVENYIQGNEADVSLYYMEMINKWRGENGY